MGKERNELTMSLDQDPLYFGACHCCWALWSLIMFDPNYDPTQNNIVVVFNGRSSEACP